jgi:protein O-mannosyl-transferase
MLVPVIGFVQFGIQAIADRFTYLPQIGLEIALAWGIADLSRSWLGRRWTYGFAWVALPTLAVLAWHQTSYWRNSKTVLEHALECNDRNSWAHLDIGVVLATDGRHGEAIEHFRRALSIQPEFADAHNNLGLVLAPPDQFQSLPPGRLQEALLHYRAALRIHPDYAQAHYNIANALAADGQFDEAITHFRKVLHMQPEFAEAHNGLGAVLAACNRFDQAETSYREALTIRPAYAEAHNNLAVVLAARGQLDEAVTHYREALKIRPDYLEAHYGIANALAARGQFDEAIIHFRIALRIRSDLTDAMNGLAWLLATCPKASLRNGPEAVKLAGRAAQFTGGNQPEALDTLAAAYAATGRFPEAVATSQTALRLAAEQNLQSLVGEIRARTALYQSGKPFIQASHPSHD